MPQEDAPRLPRISGPVLVVDDEVTPRSIVSRMVRAMGYPVRTCRSGRDALHFLAAHPRQARLLLADLGMPRMDGGELAERARFASSPRSMTHSRGRRTSGQPEG
jgi:CheY-like chemotaxis protein